MGVAQPRVGTFYYIFDQLGNMYNIKDFGTYSGVTHAVISLQSRGFKWITYPENTSALIARPFDPDAPLDSVGIQAALDAARDGEGGTVVVPAGDYIIGTLQLWSDVELRLEPGARLWASPELEHYQDPGRHLIVADNAQNAHISGHGEIHGQSPNWVIPWLHSNPKSWAEFHNSRPGKMVFFKNCRDVSVSGIKIFDSPNWTLVFNNCRGVRVDGVTMRHFDAINADGIDIVDSQDVTISNCRLHVTDDAICMKSDILAWQQDPSRKGVANVAITNCVIRTLCNAIKIGTESLGTFENITASNIVVSNPDHDVKGAESGINIALCDGGVVHGVSFHNFTMRNVECPFYIVSTPRRLHRPHLDDPAAGKIEGVQISGIFAEKFRYTPFVVGSPSAFIENLTVRDASLFKGGGFVGSAMDGDVFESGEQYPTPFMFGSPDGGERGVGDGLPSYGLYMRDVTNSSVKGYRVMLRGGHDVRPMSVFQWCRNVNINSPDEIQG